MNYTRILARACVRRTSGVSSCQTGLVVSSRWRRPSGLNDQFIRLYSSKFNGSRVSFPNVVHQKSWNPSYTSRRYFYRMLNSVFNRPDHNRIKEVGAERACAEWLLRCGAHVRWVGSNRFFTDYNLLPQSTSSFGNNIEEINCDEAAVMDVGFEHLEGLKHVKKIRFHYCPYLEDEAISQLVKIKDSLETLEITSCGDLTERGLSTFADLKNLKSLHMRDLPAVRDKAGIYSYLKKALPKCDIVFEDIQKEASK